MSEITALLERVEHADKLGPELDADITAFIRRRGAGLTPFSIFPHAAGKDATIEFLRGCLDAETRDLAFKAQLGL